jgi:hypothetical protein
MTKLERVKNASGPTLPVNEGDVIDMKMKVVSIQEKYGRYGPSWSVVAKVNEDDKVAFWHRRSAKAQEELRLNVGDEIDLHAIVKGVSGDEKMIFLEKPQIRGSTCSHRTLHMNGKGYRCQGCGSPFKGSVQGA